MKHAPSQIILIALALLLGTNCAAALPVIISVAPNTASLTSNGTLQFTATVLNTPNTTVTWFSCAGAITQSGLFTAPTVTTKTSICVYAVSQADPSKSSTAYVFVRPAPGVLGVGFSAEAFGPVTVGSNQQATETLSNSGGTAVDISSITASGAGFQFIGISLPMTLKPSQTITFNVVFAPQATGEVSGGLAIASNASNSPVNVTLTGTGVSPGMLQASATALEFGYVNLGSSNSLSEVVTNIGGSAVTISGIQVTGTDFALSSLNSPIIVLPGQNTTFDVVFEPTFVGSTSGDIAINSTASNSPVSVPLSGAGDLAPTSLATIVYPATPPNIGTLVGSGTVFTDPTWFSAGVRVTDACFDPSMVPASSTCPNGTAAAASPNNNYTVSNGGSEDDNWFNTTDTLTLVSNGGSRRYLVGVNPTTLGISRPYATNTTGCPLNSGNCSKTAGWSIGAGALQFSLVNSNTLYAIGYTSDGSGLESYTFDGPNFVNPPSPVTVEDYNQANGNCLPTNFGTATWQSDGGVTAGDAIFGTAFASPTYYYAGPDWGAGTSYKSGTLIQPLLNSPNNDTFEITTAGTSASTEPNWNSSCGTQGESCTDANGVVYLNKGTVPAGQNTGYWVAIYSAAKGCFALNTQTGAMVADVGWSGATGLTCTATQCTGTWTSPQTFTIHNVKWSKTGNWITLARGVNLGGSPCSGSNPLIWWIGGTGSNSVFCSEGGPPDGDESSGHWANGTEHMVNDPASPFYEYFGRSETSSGPGVPVAVNATPLSPECMVNTDSHASWIMANSTDTTPFGFTRTTASILTSGLMPFDTPPCAWVHEIDLADPPGGDGLVFREALTYNTGYSLYFNAANDIAAFSQDGEFASVGSDWLNTLGNAAGTSMSCVPNGPDWAASTTRPANYILHPTAGNAGNYSYQNESGASCMSGSTEPETWNQTVNGTQTDGGCTWTNVGAPSGTNACRSDVILWKFKTAQLQ